MNNEIKLVKYGFDMDTLINAWDNIQEKGYIYIGCDLWLFTLKAIKKECWYSEEEGMEFSTRYESSDDSLVFLHGEDTPIEVSSLQDLIDTLADMITI